MRTPQRQHKSTSHTQAMHLLFCACDITHVDYAKQVYAKSILMGPARYRFTCLFQVHPLKLSISINNG